MAIIWDDNLSVGIKQIDDQHKKLINLINELEQVVNNQRPKCAVPRILRCLANYTYEHFAVEEEYFNHYDYPKKVAHKKQHQYFTLKIVDFIKQYRFGGVDISSDLFNMLSKWLIMHIKGSDKEYSEYFKAQGINL